MNEFSKRRPSSGPAGEQEKWEATPAPGPREAAEQGNAEVASVPGEVTEPRRSFWVRLWRSLFGSAADASRNSEAPPSREELRRLRAERDDARGEVSRLSRQLILASQELLEAQEQARRAEHDRKTSDEMRAEVDRERAARREKEAQQAEVQGQLSDELKEALALNAKLQIETEKLRAQLAHVESELQHVTADRQRVMNEYGQLCMDAIGFRYASAETGRLKEESSRLREELEQARSASPAPAAESSAASGSLKSAEQAAELASRDQEIRRLTERVSALEQELASRGSLLPVSELPPALQQMVTHMGTAADAQRIVADLWERLMEQEARFNAAREDANRKAGQLETLRMQLAELYGNLITPLTVLSASADLLAMRQDMPQGAQAALAEMKQTMAAVRQVITRIQKISSAAGRDKS